MAGDEIFETCPTDVAHAPVETVWELVTNPTLYDWVDAKLIESPAHSLGVGDRAVFAASLGLHVSWTVLSAEPPRQLALHIALPFGMANEETIVLSRIDAEHCRITFG